MSDTDRLVLDPVLTSVARARALVGNVALRYGFDPAVAGDAALVVSELVTNAVLHARTSVDLAVGVAGATVRIEVSDASDIPVFAPRPPAAFDAGEELFDEPVDPDLDDLIEALATTGRGMELVASLAARWGVTAHAHGGKTVWAEVGLDPTAPGTARPAAPGAGAGPEAWAGPEAGAGPEAWAGPEAKLGGGEDDPVTFPAVPGERGGRAVARGTVRLVAVPLRLLVDSDRNFEDTTRELQVIALSDDVDPEIGELARIATGLLVDLGGVRISTQQTVRAARARGDRLVDVVISADSETPRHMRTLDSLLAALAAARSTGKLLVLAPPPEILAFRLWYRDEMTRQLRGEPVQPCPFPAAAAPPGPRPAAELSERRLRLLSGLRAGLAAAGDPHRVAEVALERVCTDSGAAFANLLLVEPDGTHVSGIHRVGYRSDEPHGLRYAITEDNPICEAVRTAEAIVVRTPDERRTRYPTVIPSEPLATNPTAVWVPLGDTAPASGVLVVGFGRARDFTDMDLRYLLEVARVIHRRLQDVGAS